MKSSDYRNKVIGHLIAYKAARLNLKDKNGMWRGRAYEHILTIDSETANFIAPEYYDFSRLGEHKLIIKQTGMINDEVGLHTDFAHLNSSQVMCINYFTPLSCYPVLMRALIRKFTSIVLSGKITGKFEYTTGGPDSRTSFDFYLEDEIGQRLYFEIKYTEQGFGVKKYDEKDWNKVWRQMTEQSAYLNGLSPKKFYRDYQVNRNICRVRDVDKDHVCFIVPQMSDYLWRKQNGHSYDNVHWIPWETLLLETRAMRENDNLTNYYNEFYDKYFDLK